MWAYVKIGIETGARIQEPLCLGGKPIMGTQEDPDNDYGSNYTRALGFPKMESHIWIYAFLNLMPPKERLLIILMGKNWIYYDIFYENFS